MLKLSRLYIPLAFVALLFSYCSPDESVADAPDPPPVTPPVTPPVNPPATDSATLLAAKWNLIKDSSTNTGQYYFMENGSPWVPTPGVYTGVAADYYDFQTTGTVLVHANRQSFSSTYKLLPPDKLIITAMLVHDTATVVRLSATEAIFDWENTSPNGGRYFKRVYLQR